MLKRVKIFFASSLDLKTDREQLEIFFARKNKELSKHNCFVELVMWEDFVDSVSETRLQDSYNAAIEDCDLFIMLFFNKVGKYTNEEFETAYASFLATGKPLIYTFFKIDQILINEINHEEINSLFQFKEKLKSIEHFSSEYQNIDDLKVQLYDQLEKLRLIGKDELQSDPTFADSIREGMHALNITVDELTSEQFRVIQQLRHFKRVRISGCAGSGKTLVAVEKAIRLSRAGSNTLFLCHNPYLAEYVKGLSKGNAIDIYCFEEWVQKLNGSGNFQTTDWNKWSEPVPEDIEKAFDSITKNKIAYDAIIVDEAQDFKSDWWILVEAALANGSADILYLFHDDNQALIPYRSDYPIQEPHVDLSRNCRNAGIIYEYMRSNLHHSAPAPSKELLQHGKLEILEFDEDNLTAKLQEAISWIDQIEEDGEKVILLAGDIHPSFLGLQEIEINQPIGPEWQLEVRGQLVKAIRDAKGIQFAVEKDQLIHGLKRLSKDRVPSRSDLQLITDLTSQCSLSSQLKDRLTSAKTAKGRFYWKRKDDKVRLLNRRRDLNVWSSEVIHFFQDPHWTDGLFHTKKYRIGSALSHDKDYIPALKTSLFKGLESESVILVARQRSQSILNELYVGVSRARKNLAILTDQANRQLLEKG